jgi:hypothetical protein
MNKRKLLVAFCLLLLCAGLVLAQRVRKHGGLVDILSTGSIVITPKTGQTVTIGATGTALTRIGKYTAALTPAEVAANTCAEQTFTVTGVHASDIVFVNKPTAQAGLGVAGVRASGTNQVGITFCNATASPITPTAAQTYGFGVLR